MTVRPYHPETDSDLCADWWHAHTGLALQTAVLPPLGVMAEDETGPCAAAWLYLSAGIGIAFLEMPVSRPGLSLRNARQAFKAVFGALEAAALTHDYGYIQCRSKLSTVKFAQSCGYQFSPEKLMAGSKALR